jgi:hypothetical protein
MATAGVNGPSRAMFEWRAGIEQTVSATAYSVSATARSVSATARSVSATGRVVSDSSRSSISVGGG